MQISKDRTKGFTLIEIMVVVSIIAFLTSILVSGTALAKAKALDAKTVSQVQQYQKALTLASPDVSTMPDPGDNSYYCLGKTATETCKFWGGDFNGHAKLSAIIPTGSTFNSVVIDGVVYNGAVYHCTSSSGGVCTNPYLYWVQQTGTKCIAGQAVLMGSGGMVCRQDAGSLSGGGSDNNYDSEAMGVALSVLPTAISCRAGGGLISQRPNVGTGGGAVCTTGPAASVPWPSLPGQWIWNSGYPGASIVDALYVLMRYDPQDHQKVYYIGCNEAVSCVITGPVNAMPE